jgi:hypothetical protein
MTTSGLSARRLMLPAGESAAICGRLGLAPPPGFDDEPAPIRTAGLLVDGVVHPSVAAGLAATCSPQVGVVITSTVGRLTGAFGVRGDLGGCMVRADSSDVEVAAWPALRLGEELTRAVPVLGRSPLPSLHLPFEDLAACPELAGAVVGTLRATVVAPPQLVGLVVWLATDAGWLALEPAEVRAGVRWATLRPVQPEDIGAAVAPLVASGLP